MLPSMAEIPMPYSVPGNKSVGREGGRERERKGGRERERERGRKRVCMRIRQMDDERHKTPSQLLILISM